MGMGSAKGWQVASLVLLAVVPFGNALLAGFVYDDHLLIERNPLVTDGLRLPEIFQTNYWGEQENHGLYRPLATVSFALDRAIFGLRPAAFHAVNIVLHGAAGIALYLLLLALFRRSSLAFAAAALFAVHPVHTEVVTGIAGRPEILAGLFVLISVRLALPPLDGNRLGLSLVFFLLALLSKESAIVTIALFPLALLTGRETRGAWRRAEGYVPLLCMAAVAAFWFLLRWRVTGSMLTPEGYTPPFVVNPLGHVDLLPRWATALAGLGRYMRLLLLPVNLSADYSFAQIPIREGLLALPVLISAAAVAGLVGVSALLWRRSPAVALGAGWFLLSILPASNLLFAIGTIFAERLLYLPSVGFCLLAGIVLERVGDGGVRGRKAAVAMLASICLLYAVGTASRNREWRDDEALFASAIENAPRSAKVRYELGRLRRDRDRDEDAATRLFFEATEIYPGYVQAHYDRANIYRLQGEHELAVVDYRRAIEVEPGFAAAYHNLGLSLSQLGHLEGAAEAIAKAIDLEPEEPTAWWDLAAIYGALGSWEDTVATLEGIIERDPSNATAHLQLAKIYIENLKDKEKARHHIEAAARIDPDHPALQVLKNP